MKYIPIGNRVLVKLDGHDNMIGDLYIPETVKRETPVTGKVIALGTGGFDEKGNEIPWEVKVGDRVIVMHTLDRVTVQLTEGTCDIYRQDEILGTIEDE